MSVFIEEEAVHEHSRVERVRLQADLGRMLTDLAVDDILVVAVFVSMKSTKVTAREARMRSVLDAMKNPILPFAKISKAVESSVITRS